MKCFVTKLQGVVDNDNLYKVNETRFIIPNGVTLNINTEDCIMRILNGAMTLNNDAMVVKQEYKLMSWGIFKSLQDNTVLSVLNPSRIIGINAQGTSSENRIVIPDATLFNRYSMESVTNIHLDVQFAPFGYVPKLKAFGEDVNYAYVNNFNWDNFDIKHLPALINVALNTGVSYAVSNLGKHIGLTNISLIASAAYGTMESLGEAMVKNGRTSGKMTVICGQAGDNIGNNTTWKGEPTTYQKKLYYNFDPSLSGGYEITDTEPTE